MTLASASTTLDSGNTISLRGASSSFGASFSSELVAELSSQLCSDGGVAMQMTTWAANKHACDEEDDTEAPLSNASSNDPTRRVTSVRLVRACPNSSAPAQPIRVYNVTNPVRITLPAGNGPDDKPTYVRTRTSLMCIRKRRATYNVTCGGTRAVTTVQVGRRARVLMDVSMYVR
jgi:hypothetical protein